MRAGRTQLGILIVDESPFFRRWFHRLVLTIPGIRIVGEVRDPLAAVGAIQTRRPDAVILDSKAGWRTGIDVVGSIRSISPIPKLIVVTSGICFFCHERLICNADYIVDKITGYQHIPEILRQLSAPGLSHAMG